MKVASTEYLLLSSLSVMVSSWKRTLLRVGVIVAFYTTKPCVRVRRNHSEEVVKRNGPRYRDESGCHPWGIKSVTFYLSASSDDIAFTTVVFDLTTLMHGLDLESF